MNVFRRKRVLFVAIALLACSSTAWAVCRPNNCATRYHQCLNGGGDETACELAYYRCLQSYGCPIP
ncbi:hypothetical protein [Lysobacter silvisoli]|uniref:Kazal-like domain-containing protein n=1 Tax=Lysobacter silvisoli TaxID=2293254 RepID=A0A371K334_9GAMM|nr:hypothetical protein [Lysobacter silvisoli]RDZ28339.1 hypothetical protein DX914_04155 [Lysobacter silvisoli]